MDRATRLRIFWCAVALLGVVIFAMGFITSFEIRLGAIVGGGDEQKTYDYARSWSLASYGTTLSIAALIASVALVGAALLGLSRRAHIAALVAVTLLALGLSAFATTPGFLDYDPGSAEGCTSWSECGGPFLNPGIQRIRREAAKKPEAKLPGYEFDPPAYAARSFLPWTVIQYGSFILLCAAGFLLFRSVPILIRAGPAFAPIALIAANSWSSSINCEGGLSSAEAREGALTLYLALFGLLSGVTALTLKRWKLGALTLGITVVAGVVAVFIVGFTCENS